MNFFYLLTLLLVGLKLTGVIDWSWFLVTAPTWGLYLFMGAYLYYIEERW